MADRLEVHALECERVGVWKIAGIGKGPWQAARINNCDTLYSFYFRGCLQEYMNPFNFEVRSPERANDLVIGLNYGYEQGVKATKADLRDRLNL